MDLFDFHAHFFARPFFDALAAQSPLEGSGEEKLAQVTSATGIELPSEDVKEHAARWLAELDQHGVARMAAFASLPEEVPAVAEAAEVQKYIVQAVKLMAQTREEARDADEPTKRTPFSSPTATKRSTDRVANSLVNSVADDKRRPGVARYIKRERCVHIYIYIYK